MKYEEYARGDGERRRRSPSEIESDVETIRGEMSETLRHIENRFSPRQVLEHLLGGAKRAGGESADFAKNLGSTIRDNPVPILLLAAGVGSLLAAQRRGGASHGSSSVGTHRIGGELRGRAEEASERAGEMAERVREGGERLRERGAQARERAREARDRARERAAGARERVRDATHEARERGTQILNDQPLVVIGLGLTAGAILGATLPMSETEHRRIGPARDRMVQRTKEAARGQMQELRETGSAAAQPSAATPEPDVPDLTGAGVTPPPGEVPPEQR